MKGYAESFNSKASVYSHSQPPGPSPSTTQECVLSPVSSSMALFAYHAQAVANPDCVSALAGNSTHFNTNNVDSGHVDTFNVDTIVK
ncbi:hypothetical protein DSO57_1006426 [Entomophthora muscae]|uniref:Uncharacterized protein n=1 Tax=Entomophthora muscae TaxID=34485 RepID=A0ACC2UH39_9FUNG|nr:hypothetical protein DSO57_1006426 [Entomophthora muscae]